MESLFNWGIGCEDRVDLGENEAATEDEEMV
jgi:hypothetical protein